MRFQRLSRAAIAVIVCFPAWLPLARAAPATKPNVVFILADDLGYGDVECFGADRCRIETPHFDRPAPYAGRNRKATDGQLKELEKEGRYASGVYRGYKFSVYEGGFRVPFVVRWPGVVRAGATCDRLVGLHDLMATLAGVVGCTLAGNQGPDSISMQPLFRDPSASERSLRCRRSFGKGRRPSRR